MSGTDWYLQKNGQNVGPLSWEQLRELARAGDLAPSDCVWTADQTAVMMASSVKGLFPSQAKDDATPTKDAWFYGRDAQKVGPLRLEQLQQLAAAGQLQPSDMVLQEGGTKWMAAKEIKNLFPGMPTQETGLLKKVFEFVGVRGLVALIIGVVLAIASALAHVNQEMEKMNKINQRSAPSTSAPTSSHP